MQLKPERLWHVELAVLVAIALQISLPQHLSVGPKYLISLLELFLLVGLRLAETTAQTRSGRWRRRGSLILTALITVANIASLVMVSDALISGNHQVSGLELIVSALSIYATNIIIFGLWYWQLDGGGHGGHGTHTGPIDFLFPQMNTPTAITKEPNWRPAFFDYLYVSITNATAFSPTDALPLTHRAKLLMSVQGMASLATVALVAARAINILH